MGEFVKTPHTEATEAISFKLESGDASAVARKLRKSTPQVPDYGIAAAGLEERWATVAGYRMRYLGGGTGPPLVLIPGLLGYSFSWRFNFSALAPHATVYAPDLLGLGFSDRGPGLDGSLRAHAERMLEFMDQVGLEQADVLGTSHGGAIAMMTAVLGSNRRRVRRLILVAPVNPWSRHGAFVTRILGTAPGALCFRALQPALRRTRGYFLRRMYGDPRRVPPGSVEGYAAALDIPGTVAHGLRIVQGWHAGLRALAAALPAIRDIPTLLVWGSRDPAVLPTSAPKVAAQFSNAKLVMMEGVGHLPYEEAPEEFNRVVIEFLESGNRAIG
jgi:pimeloyl-ACP methyl ester carboxylesterase